MKKYIIAKRFVGKSINLLSFFKEKSDGSLEIVYLADQGYDRSFYNAVMKEIDPEDIASRMNYTLENVKNEMVYGCGITMLLLPLSEGEMFDFYRNYLKFIESVNELN